MSIIEKVKAALGNMGAKVGIVSAAARKMAEQEQIKVQLMAKHGVEVGEILFDSALKLSQETEMTLKEAADLVEERKLALDKFAADVSAAWNVIRGAVIAAWDQIKDLVGVEDPKAEAKRKRSREVHVRKMRSQRKNWKKYKKRKR